WAHDPSHVRRTPPPERLAVTKALTAIAPDHPELAAAREARIPIEPWQQVVADAAVGRTLIGVAGTHGKSTTAGWLVHVLASAGLDPAAFVGALLPAELTGGLPATARRGGGAAFVVEADEYAGNFDAYRTATGPAGALIGRIVDESPDGTTVMLDGLGPFDAARPVRLPTAGRHNVANALGVVGALSWFEIRGDDAARGLASFPGVGRRLERKGG